ncbi:hypothetical protein ACWGJX_38060 [Streptomyces sp. NPDC054775]
MTDTAHKLAREQWSTIGRTSSDPADIARYTELTGPSPTFRNELKTWVDSALNKTHQPPTTHAHILATWQQLPHHQRHLPLSQLATTLANTLTHHQPPQLPGGGAGIEVEFTEILTLAPRRRSETPLHGIELARRMGTRLVVETKDFYRGADNRVYRREEDAVRKTGSAKAIELMIPEVVTEVQRSLPHERMRYGRGNVFTDLRDLERKFYSLATGKARKLPIEEIFPQREGWYLTEDGLGAHIHPRAINDWKGAHVHYTLGVPIQGLHGFLRHVYENTWRDDKKGYLAKAHLGDGFDVADEITARYAIWREHKARSIPSYVLPSSDVANRVSGDPAALSLRGHIALLYSGVATLFHAFIYRGLDKTNAAILSRNSMKDILAELPEDVREYLDIDSENIRAAMLRRIHARLPNFEAEFTRLKGRPLPSNLFYLRLPKEDENVGEYVDGGLISHFESGIPQAVAFHMTDLEKLDSDAGNERLPLIVIEVRSYGERHVSAQKAQHYYETLVTKAAALHSEAMSWREQTLQQQRFVESTWSQLRRLPAVSPETQPLASAVQIALRDLARLHAVKPPLSFENTADLLLRLSDLDRPQNRPSVLIVRDHLATTYETVQQLAPQSPATTRAKQLAVDSISRALRAIDAHATVPASTGPGSALDSPVRGSRHRTIAPAQADPSQHSEQRSSRWPHYTNDSLIIAAPPGVDRSGWDPVASRLAEGAPFHSIRSGDSAAAFGVAAAASGGHRVIGTADNRTSTGSEADRALGSAPRGAARPAGSAQVPPVRPTPAGSPWTTRSDAQHARVRATAPDSTATVRPSVRGTSPRAPQSAPADTAARSGNDFLGSRRSESTSTARREVVPGRPAATPGHGSASWQGPSSQGRHAFERSSAAQPETSYAHATSQPRSAPSSVPFASWGGELSRRPDDMTSDEITAHLYLRAAALSHDPRRLPNHPGPIGPDLFGLTAPQPTPAFLHDQTGRPYEYRHLPSSASGPYLRSMAIRLGQHRAPIMDPRSLVPAGHTVSASSQAVRLPHTSGAPTIPHLVHAIWLGGALRPTGASKSFWDTFGKPLYPDGFHADFILWTDVPRSDFIAAASENARHTDPVHMRDVRAMAHWAHRSGIFIVNVHEVFNAHDPMMLHAEFATETAKEVGSGWAAASDILRLEILNRFGGLYNDGDNTVINLALAFESALAREDGFAANIASTNAFTNSGMLMPPHHPFAARALESIREKYTLTQKDLYEKSGIEFSDMVWTSMRAIDMHGLQFRRNSVMLRTGPHVYLDVASKFGLTHPSRFPKLSGIMQGKAFSWSEGAEGPPQRTRTAQETLQFTAEITHTMIRSLYNRNGDLHLTAIQDAITKHQRPDVIWKSAFNFIAAHRKLRLLVRGVTLNRRELTDEMQEHMVRLPEDVQAMLRHLPEGAPAPVGDSNGWWRGERSFPVELNAPSNRRGRHDPHTEQRQDSRQSHS